MEAVVRLMLLQDTKRILKEGLLALVFLEAWALGVGAIGWVRLAISETVLAKEVFLIGLVAHRVSKAHVAARHGGLGISSRFLSDLVVLF